MATVVRRRRAGTGRLPTASGAVPVCARRRRAVRQAVRQAVDDVGELRLQLGERQFDRGRVGADQHRSRRQSWLERSQDRPQPAAEPVAHHGRSEGASERVRHERGRGGRFGTPATPECGTADPFPVACEVLERRPGTERDDQAERRARPLARRLLSTARPARVDMRARKPCFLARRWVFGWKVRFTNVLLDRRGARSPAAVDLMQMWNRRRCAGTCDLARLRRPACHRQPEAHFRPKRRRVLTSGVRRHNSATRCFGIARDRGTVLRCALAGRLSTPVDKRVDVIRSTGNSVGSISLSCRNRSNVENARRVVRRLVRFV
jgi:hypothetical protein